METFTGWKRAVDMILFELIGLDSDGLPDYDYMRAFNSGWSAHKTAKAAITNARNS